MMWSKYVTRRLAVQVAQAWNFGWGEAMAKVYGVSLNNTLVYRDDKKTDYYVDERQHEEYVRGLYRLLEDEDFLAVFHQDAQSKLENILSEITQQFRKNLAELSNAQLLDMFENFVLPNVEQFYVRMWTVFNIGEPLANAVREVLKGYIKDEAKLDDYLLSLSSPMVANDVMNERKDLLELAIVKDRLSDEGFDGKLNEHVAKYRHIPVYDFDHEPYTKGHFLNELAQIKNPPDELEEIKKVFAGRNTEFNQIIAELQPDPHLLKLLEFLKYNVFLRDYRDMIRQKLNVQLRKFYEEIGKRIGLGVEQVAILTNDEISEHLGDGKLYSKDEITRREHCFLLIQKGDQVDIYSGEQAMKKAEEELRFDDLEEVNELRGIIGAKGKAQGRAVVVFTNRELEKVQEGNIMVATMTRQDFVPAMRRSAGLVTDEGSVTCHAAIIARELKLPCIVAAKVATQMIKTGDLVEVDAENGVVKILE